MPADHNKKYKDADYYISRLTFLPADYLAMVRELKNKITSRRLLVFTLRELCAQLRLDDAARDDSSLLEHSGQIYLGISHLTEKFGLKLIPAVIPSTMQPDCQVVLTARPNLNNDDDISHVQDLVKRKRRLTQRDMIYVQRMQEKLANYNIMLRVFEGLSLICTPQLKPQQMSVIDAELTARSMPVEGARFLRACYSYYAAHPLPQVSFADKKLCLRRMDKDEHNQEICRILIRTAAAGECRLQLDPDYPLLHELQLQGSSSGSTPPESVPQTARSADAGKIIAEQIHLAGRAATAELAAHPAGLSDAVQRRLRQLICGHLKADSCLLPCQLQLLDRLLRQNPQALLLMPSFSDLSFTLNQSAHPRLQHSLSIVTTSRRDKLLYPFFILAEQAADPAAAFDPAGSDVFVTPFTMPAELSRHQAAAFGTYVGALVCFYLLQRSFFLGWDPQNTALFHSINNHFINQEFKPSTDLLLSCGLFYYLYQQHFAPASAGVPDIVLASMLLSPALLTLFAQRILRCHRLYLASMNEAELEVVLLYILHIIRNAHFVRGERHMDLHHAKTRRAFLKKIAAFCLQKESRLGRPLFLQFTSGQLPPERFYFDAVNEKKFFSGPLFNDFMGLVPDLMIRFLAFDQVAAQPDFELIKLADFEDPAGSYASLMQELVAQQSIITYLSLNEQLLPAQFYAALNSAESFTPLLREAFPLISSIGTTQLLRRFGLESSQSDLMVLRFILDKAGLIAVPQLPQTTAELQRAWQDMRFMVKPARLDDAPAELLLSRLPRIQTAVHLLLTACDGRLPAPVYQAVLDQCCAEIGGGGAELRSLLDSFIRLLGLLVQKSCRLSAEQLPEYYSSAYGQDSSRKLLTQLCSTYLQLIGGCAGAAFVQKIRDNFRDLAERMHMVLPGIEPKKGSIPAPRKQVAGTRAAARAPHQLDLQLIKSKQQESHEVLSVIGKIRDANEESLLDEPESETAASAPAAAEGNQESPEVPGHGQQLAALLDVPALHLLSALQAQQSEVMDLPEFEGLCLSAGFMSSSVAIEMLNDFAFAHFDEPFLEASPMENAVYISTWLITEILPED